MPLGRQMLSCDPRYSLKGRLLVFQRIFAWAAHGFCPEYFSQIWPVKVLAILLLVLFSHFAGSGDLSYSELRRLSDNSPVRG